jgi:imidazolonepropionase-like amidohydrolase
MRIGLIALALSVTAALAAPSIATAKGALAVVGARIYPSPGAKPIDDGAILIDDGRIVAVGQRRSVRIPQSVPVLDASGGTVTAGFWNSHVHIMPEPLLGADKAPAARLQAALQEMLTRWGFTTVFDLASSTDNALALRRRIDSGEVLGPNLLTVGDPFFPKNGTPIYVRQYMATHGFADEEVASPEQAAARARRQLDRGTDGVKIFAGAIVGGKVGVLPMPVDVATAVVAEAHRHGKPAFAHPSNMAGLNVAIASGVDVLAHTTATESGDSSAAGWTPELIARLRAHNTALIPTLTLFEVEAKRGGEKPEDLARTLEVTTSEVRDYAAAGGQILFGTDVGYTDAFDTTEEYRLLSRALDWKAILASLTTAPAQRFGYGAHKGRIAKGMDADLVILDADPATDPTAFARVRETVRAGQVIWKR